MIRSIVKSSLLAAVASLLVCSASYASLPEGAKPQDWKPNPDRHKITIERVASTKTEKKMLSIAESTYPKRSDIIKVWALKDAEAPATQDLWHYTENEGILIPYAITGKAVDYYESLVKSYQTKSWHNYLEPSSSLDYKASSSHYNSYAKDKQTYKNVYVVKMDLRFEASWIKGSSAISFVKEREVILNPKGKVLAVFGDGPTDVITLAY